jgi:fumarate reductase flavoprotein subunit
MQRLFTLAWAIIFLSASAVLVSAQQPPGNGPLLQKHLGLGVTCNQCHKEAPPSEMVRTPQCLTCHVSFDALAERLEGKGQANPHGSHNGDVPCDRCHHVHRASENFCSSCHQFEFKVP